MGISIYNIKKWTKMIFGKSIMHVNQGIGKMYTKNNVKGYYNDLTEKVTKDIENYYNIEVFPHKSETATEGIQKVFFPIAIFQYGLGAYDLYLIDHSELMFNKFKNHVIWAYENQNSDGSWDNFGFIYPENKYSAMAQGEGCSLLLRAYVEFHEEKYFIAAKRAIDFMLKSLNEGGTTYYKKDSVVFLEYTNQPVVLNGWIFAIFGLYDYVLISKDKSYEVILNKTLNTLETRIRKFDCKYWTYYDEGKKIASPFYHHLHIAQIKVLGDIFSNELFTNFSKRWERYEKNKLFKLIAFVKKAFQKIIE